MPAAQVEKVIVKTSGALLQDVHVFDQFEGGNLPQGLRSVGFRMTFQDPKATLTEDTLQGLQAKIISAVSQNLKVTTR
jgi:phenylalanyl-tRNA synthetase beta chain